MSSSGGVPTALGNVTLSGALALPERAVAVNTAMTATDFAIQATGGAGGITVTLPAAPAPGRLCSVKKVDAGVGAVTVAPAAGTLDGAASQALGAQNVAVLVQFDGANWQTVAQVATTIL